MTSKLLYIDMDNVLVDFASGIARLPQEVAVEYEGRLDDVPGIFSLMDPLPGAVESFEYLAGLYDTYILSTAPWNNPSAWSDKLLWVKHHLGAPAYKRLILSHHKNLNAGHYLVDDRTKNGAERFPGEHIHFGSDAFPNWDAVVAYLKCRATQEAEPMPARPLCHDYTPKASRSGWGVVRFECLAPGAVAMSAWGLKDTAHQALEQAYLLTGEEVVISMPDGDVLYEITKISYEHDPCDRYHAELRYIQHLTGFRIVGQFDPQQMARALEWGQQHHSNRSRNNSNA